MWCLVVDRLLRLLSEAGFFTRAYADDVIIIIIADDQGIAVNLIRSALSIVTKWCREVQLTVNSEKAEHSGAKSCLAGLNCSFKRFLA